MALRVSGSNLTGGRKQSSDTGKSSVFGLISRKQAADKAADAADAKEAVVEEKPPGMLQLMKYNRPELGYLVLGTIASMLAGSMMPVFALTMAQIIDAFEIRNYDSIAS